MRHHILVTRPVLLAHQLYKAILRARIKASASYRVMSGVARGIRLCCVIEMRLNSKLDGWMRSVEICWYARKTSSYESQKLQRRMLSVNETSLKAALLLLSRHERVVGLLSLRGRFFVGSNLFLSNSAIRSSASILATGSQL